MLQSKQPSCPFERGELCFYLLKNVFSDLGQSENNQEAIPNQPAIR